MVMCGYVRSRGDPMRVAFHPWIIVAAMAAWSMTLRAGEVVPLLLPQWTASVSQDGLVFDYIGASADPAALRLTDGGEVTVTVTNSEIVLRRYAADGSVQRAQSATVGDMGSIDVVLRATAANDAFYVLAGGDQSDALLMRFDSELERTWMVTLPDEAICQQPGECLRLEVLDDNSVVAMRAFDVMRVGSDGLIRWSFSDSNASGNFLGGDLAIDSTAIWVATSGSIDYYDPTATLTRLDFDGAQLSADVSSCHGCGGVSLADIDLTADGGARVVGNSGDGGFFARYDALGYRLFWAASDTQQTYYRLDHDDANTCYVLSGDPWTKTVTRIDLATGATLWSAPADDFVARDAGVATILKTSSAIEASAIDASGVTMWSLPLTQSNGGGYLAWSRPALVDGDVELLVSDLAVSDDPCATYPRVTRIDALGTLTRFPLPCRGFEMPATISDIDATHDGGVLVNTLAHLTSYSPNGDLRWRLEACRWCTDSFGASQWPAAAIVADGGAWAVRWDRPTLALPSGQTKIQRFDANGILAFEVASTAGAGSYCYGNVLRLLSGIDDVVMLRAFGQGLSWQRVGGSGADLGSHTFSIPDNEYNITDARRLPDGGTLVLTKGHAYCDVGCPPFYVTVLQIAVDGTLVWRYQFPEAYAPEILVALRADGSAAAVLPTSNGLLAMRLIGSDGSIGSDIPLVEVDPFVWPQLLTTALQGRWLLSTEANTGEQAYWVLDSDGHAAIERRNAPFSVFLQTSALGYLINAPISVDAVSTVLLDPETLVDRARFYNGTGDTYGPDPWRILDDGSVYGTITLPQSGYQAIARYSAPGGMVSDVIFRNGMD